MRMIKAVAMASVLLAPAAAWAQESLEFRGSGWVNVRELHLDRLRGKVVVLYFYEEG